MTMAAEVLLAAVLRKAIDIGGDLAVEEGSRLYWLSEDVDWIEREMKCIQSYIADAQAKQACDLRVANLLKEIEDLARDVKDILEKLPPQESRKGFFGFLKNVACFIPYVYYVHIFAMEMAKIRKRVEDIDRRRKSYGILDTGCNTTSVSDWDLRRSYLYADEPKVVGLDKDCTELEKRLLDNKLEYGFVSIVGMPGLGKTTLAKRIYRHVRHHFDCSAMIYVSQEPRIGELFFHIAKQVGCPTLGEEWSKEGPEEKLCSYLRDKRYVILLDDIWDVETWDALKLGFPSDSKSGTRIIITSRDTNVGRYIGGESSIHESHPLDSKRSWKLFYNEVMMPEKNTETTFPKELKDIGEQIVETCGGVPLSIVVTAGVLRQRGRNQHAWTEVFENISHQHEQDKCTRAVALSYDNLPTPVKDCFLYLGLFPKGHEIVAFDLINMWVAEKFIFQQDDEDQEEEAVAERYLNTLVARNLVQVASRRCSTGRIKSCRIHDILHNFCVLVAKEKRFFRKLNAKRSNSVRSVSKRVQRAAFEFNTDLKLENNINFSEISHIRSLLCFKTSSKKDIRFCERLIRHFPSFSLLRVLNLEFRYCRPHFPSGFWNLYHLRYLRLRGVSSVRFPSRITGLKNLQVLDVLKCSLVFFPETILSMKQLRHLLLPNWNGRGPIIPERSWDDCTSLRPVKVCLPNLHTLHTVSGEDLESCGLFNFTSLRKLGIFDVSEELIDRLSCSMNAFQKLESLSLDREFSLVERWEVSRLNLSGCRSLLKLRIKAPWGTLPHHKTFPPNLVELSLSSNKITDDPMMTLKNLPKLRILKLKNSHLFSAAQVMNCSGPEAFPQLQTLHIENVSHLRELISDDDPGLPKLETVRIRKCIPLSTITGRIEKKLNQPSSGAN